MARLVTSSCTGASRKLCGPLLVGLTLSPIPGLSLFVVPAMIVVWQNLRKKRWWWIR
jgi:hypothetical protein